MHEWSPQWSDPTHEMHALLDVDELEPAARLSIGPWSRPALRGFLVLLAVIGTVVGYLVWQAQPRSVAVAPEDLPLEVLATGAPLTGEASPAATGDAPVTPAQDSTGDSAAAAEIVVHVTGLVRRPGLVRLPAGARVADAIELAGGVTRRRAEGSVNLARVLVDGEQIVVADAAAALGSTTPAAVSTGSAGGAPLDLNSATVEQLDSLPGVGPVLAGRILQWRTTHGRFRSVDELGEVSGIGDAILGQLRPLVRV